jgi:tetratricopeptide (TPR) repeat protein
MMKYLWKQITILGALFLLTGGVVSGQGQVVDSTTKSRIEELVRRGILLEEAHLWRSAIDANKEVLELDPKNVSVMNTIAGLHGTLGEYQEEVAWALKAIEVDPLFELAYINYGNGLAGLGRIEEAQAAFSKAVELAPRDPRPIYSLGVLAENQGKIEQALGYYERSVALDKRFESGYFNMAAMLANLGRFEEATAKLKKLLEINPEAHDAKQMLQRIENDKARKLQ